jgi:aspartyl-tRNA(Asn)/glutamyl-tRNA(Gln) amidotransferase subunit A
LVNLQGVFPLSWSLDHAGPLARTSEDARLLLEALTGKTFQANRQLKGIRFGVIQRQGREVESKVTEVFDAACQALLEAGAEIEEVEIPGLEQADPALFGVLLPEASAIHARWINGRAEDYAPLTRTQIELGFAIPAVTHLRAQQFRRQLTRQFLKALGEVDALISPTVAWVAPQDDPVFTADEGAAEGRRTVPHNLTGLPALSVNAGFGAQGLPVGIQVVTKPHTDAYCLAIGSGLEALLPQAQKLAPLAPGQSA